MLTRVGRWPDGFDRYLRTEQTVVVDDRLRQFAADIVPERQGPAKDLARSYLYAAAIPNRRRSISDNALPAVETRNTMMM